GDDDRQHRGEDGAVDEEAREHTRLLPRKYNATPQAAAFSAACGVACAVHLPCVAALDTRAGRSAWAVRCTGMAIGSGATATAAATSRGGMRTLRKRPRTRSVPVCGST